MPTMGFMPTMISNTKRILKHSKSHPAVPRGQVAVYVGYNEKKRYVVPLTYLSHPWFQELLHRAEEEFGFRHPMGGLTIPCEEEEFMVACRLSSS